MGGLTGSSGSGSSGGGLTGGSGTSKSGGLAGKRKERENLLQKLGGAGKDVGTTALNPVLKALEIADLGRSAVVSGAKEIDDAVPLLEQLDKLVLGKKPKDSQDSSASLSDLVRQTKEHIGYGDFVDTGNQWADRALGFTGDVALDPLSYVTFGASQAGTAGAKAVRVSAKDAARELAAKGEKELAETVLRRNVGALTAEQAADVGLKQGATIGIGSSRVRIPGTGGLARGVNKVTAPIREAALTSKLGRAAATKLSAAAEAVPNGSLLDRLQFDDALQASKAKAAGLGQRHRQTLGELIRTHKGADTDELRRALEGEAPTSAASSDVRKLLNDVADDTERLTGRVVPRLEDYLPHQLTRDFKEALAEGGIRGRRSGGSADSLLRREKRVGQQWFGRELETGSIDEMNAIAKDALGDNYVGVFKENPWEIVHSYIGSMEREAQRSGLDRTLVERGIGGAKVTPSSEKAIPGAKAAQKRLLREAENEAALAAKGPGIELGDDGVFTATRAPEASTVDLIRGSMPSAADVRSTAAKGTRRAAKAERLVEDQDALRDALYALKERGPESAAGRGKYAARFDIKPLSDVEIAKSAKALKGHGVTVDFLRAANAMDADQLTAAFKDATARFGALEGRVVGDAERNLALGHLSVYKSMLERATPRSVDASVVSPIKAAAKAERTAPEAFAQVDPDLFHEAVSMATKVEKRGRSVGETVYVYSPEEYAGMRTFLSPDGKTGFAIKEDGDLVSVFSISGNGSGESAVRRAVAEGARKLDAFDESGYLPQKYGKFGFEEVRREAWDPQYAPEGWRGETPDVVYMERPKPTLSAEEIMRAKEIAASVAAIDGQGAKVAQFRSTVAAQGDRPSMTAADAKLAELGAQRGALLDELTALKQKATPASTATPNAVDTSATAKARKVVADLRQELDHAQAAVNGADDVAAANAQRLTAMQSMKGELKAKGAAELAARKEADHFFAEAAKMRATRQGDLAAIATLEGMMKRSEADAAQHSLRAMEKLNAASAVRLTHVTSDARAMYEDGLKQFAKDKWADPWVAEAVASADNLLSPGEIGRFAKLFDTVTSRWKAYSLLSPGFHERNFMGGMFNNSLAGMDPRHYFTYAKGARAIRKGGFEAIKDPEIRAAFEAMENLGILEGHNVRDLSDVAGTGSKKGLLGQKLTAVDPSNLDNAALRTNARAARAVERELRGPLFIDTYLKTGSAERAMEQVVKYHFDYSDLSSFEQKYMKRLFPFYTWTRKNFPLQINEMIAKPGRYTRYLHAKRNIEMGTEPDQDVPSYYNDLLAIRSPFHSGDNPLYLTPDLPFRDVTEVANPMRAISQLNPLIKTPLEASSGTQYFTGVPFTNRLTPVPRTWTPIAQLIRPFNGKLGLPKIATGKDGALYISDKDAYKIEQMLPLLGRMRRLAPSEERYQTRATTTWLSFVFGLGGRTLDEASQFGEVNRQVRELQSIRRRQQELGS